MLFTHEWKPNDPLAKGGDGLGPVYNAASCVACHGQPTVGGASGKKHNVTLFTLAATTPTSEVRTGLVHAHAVEAKYQERLNKVDPSLPPIAQPEFKPVGSLGGGRMVFGFDFTVPTTVILSQRNTPALYGAKWIDELNDRDILAHEKKERLRRAWRRRAARSYRSAAPCGCRTVAWASSAGRARAPACSSSCRRRARTSWG